MQDFHFYHELKKEKYYDPLIPKKETGLVIVLLYEEWKSGKYSSNSFTEEAVKSAIEQVASDLGRKTPDRTPHSRFKEVNLQLQEYFLLRNEDTNLYNITQYGLDFCERLRDKLLLEFDPTVIEKILADLIDSLRKYRESDFSYWYNIHFLARQTTIKNQVETLFRKVDDAVKEFRRSTKSDDATFLETVRKVDQSMEIIGSHSEELKGAFYDAEEIKALLTELSFQEITNEIITQRESVRSFIEEINNDLRIISQRIERIRPKLRQFISSINQRNFDRNTELFLRFLLQKSTLQREGNKKKVKLPHDIPTKVISQPETNFIIIEDGRIQPKQPTSIILPKENPEKRQKQLDKAEDRFFIRNRVRFWLTQFENEISSKESFDFTPNYFIMLEQEQQFGNTISLKVASELFKKYTKLKTHKVAIDKTVVNSKKYPSLAIWKMNIQKITN